MSALCPLGSALFLHCKLTSCLRCSRMHRTTSHTEEGFLSARVWRKDDEKTRERQDDPAQAKTYTLYTKRSQTVLAGGETRVWEMRF